MDNQDSKSLEVKDPVKQIQEKPKEFLITGIGASAGGIQALQNFFTHVPEDSGIAYVVILHLSPDFDSQLAAILQRIAKIPVTQVTEKTTIHPNHVYVIPPDRHLSMSDGSILVAQNTNTEERRAPVDIFFRTLADEHGPRAITVILSGTGANGSMGLKRVKERGGCVFVQSPQEAEFNEMPRNAIATEMIDEVLNVAEIPAKIIAYKDNLAKIHISEEAEKRPEDEQQALREIFTQIRLRTGHDFSNYKRPTLLRRIERRISIHNLPDLPAYAAYLNRNLDETQALLKDLLISVTNFFRDKKPFQIIENDILPLLLKGKTDRDQLRIWVAGCATGEEAYSLAILCAEKVMDMLDAPRIQIFATDIDESSIQTAREGIYTLNDAADVSPERLRRYFQKEAGGYRIRMEIREMIMFASHNFLKDPPFSHLDLVSCRNVMIYLNNVAQERVIETFHFALNPGAYLFLGTSESVDGATDLYAVYNRENHIFQSCQTGPRSYPVPETTHLQYSNKNKPDNGEKQDNKTAERISFGDLHQQMLEEYAAPSVVINEEHDIVHLTDRAGRYLQVSGGEPSKNLLKLIKPEISLELRSALYQAVQRKSGVEVKGLRVKVDDKTETINIHVKPVLRFTDTARGYILVLFAPATGSDNQEKVLTSETPIAKHLEEELIRLKGRLRTANEQHEYQAEEMKANNEELQAINEELRSAAEELETSKEELQSMNEELRTVNQELKVKIEETSVANNNLQNLINSTDVGTVFLDRNFRIALFTPAARDIFNLIPADHGRLLSDITNNLAYTNLMQDAETVLDKLKIIEEEVRTIDNRFYLMRITPYRTDEDRIKGVVITFLNITDRLKAEVARQESEQKYKAVFDSISEGFSLLDIQFNEKGEATDVIIRDANPAQNRIDGLQAMIGKRIKEILPDVEKKWIERYANIARTGVAESFIDWSEANQRWYEVNASRIGGHGSTLVAIVYNDITERKQTEEVKAADFKDLQTLHDLSIKRLPEENRQVLFDEILQAGISITKADAGSLQILDEEKKELKMIASYGLSKEMAEYFKIINASSNTSIGKALAHHERIFSDYDDPKVTNSDGFVRKYVKAGYLTGQSTPLIDRSDKAVGMIITHSRQHQYRLSDRELRYLDLLARQAADLIGQLLAKEMLQQNMEDLSRFNQLMVNRELNMIEMKKEVNKLLKEAGKPEKYPLVFENNATDSNA